MAATIRLSQQHSCSLDHLNDPLPRGSSADSGGTSSLATGHAAPSRLTSSTLFHSPLHARPRRRSSILDIRSFASSLRALGLPCPEGTRLTCTSLFVQLSAHPRAFGHAPARRLWRDCAAKSLAKI